MPSPGKIRGQRPPQGPGVRYDGGTYPGYEVPIFYDPMLAKLVVWAADRKQAIARMRRALDEYRVDGIRTSVPFHRQLMDSEKFIAGDIHTGYLADHPELLTPGQDPWLKEIAVIAASIAHFREVEQRSAQASEMQGGGTRSYWKWVHRGGAWRS